MCVGVWACMRVCACDCVWGGEIWLTVCLNVWVHYVCVVRVDIHICIWDTYMHMGPCRSEPDGQHFASLRIHIHIDIHTYVHIYIYVYMYT